MTSHTHLNNNDPMQRLNYRAEQVVENKANPWMNNPPARYSPQKILDNLEMTEQLLLPIYRCA